MHTYPYIHTHIHMQTFKYTAICTCKARRKRRHTDLLTGILMVGALMNKNHIPELERGLHELYQNPLSS